MLRTGDTDVNRSEVTSAPVDTLASNKYADMFSLTIIKIRAMKNKFGEQGRGYYART